MRCQAFRFSGSLSSIFTAAAASADREEDRPPPALEKIADAQQHVRNAGHLPARVLDEDDQLRQQIGEKHDRQRNAGHHDERRIDQRRHHLAAQRLHGVQILALPVQDGGQRSARLARRDEVGIEFAEAGRHRLQRAGERHAVAHLLAQPPAQVLEQRTNCGSPSRGAPAPVAVPR